MIVAKANDTEFPWVVNADLTGATVRVLATPVGSVTVTVLSSSVTDATAGTGVATVPTVGKYRLEVEATQAGKVFTFPNDGYTTLIVKPDLG